MFENHIASDQFTGHRGSSAHVHHSSAHAHQAGNGFDPWIIWVTFRRCWPWAIPIGTLLACVVAIVVNETFVPEYKAGHWLEARQDYLVYKGVMPTVNDLARTERTFFFSPIVLDPVLTDPKYRKAPSLSDPATADANIRKNLSLASGGTTSRLIVSYTDTDPVAAKEIADAIALSYLNSRKDLDQSRVSRLVSLLRPELERQKQRVDDARLNVETLTKETLGYVPTERMSVFDDSKRMKNLNDLQSQLTEMRVELAVFDAEQMRFREEQGLNPEIPEFKPPAIDLTLRPASESKIREAIEKDSQVTDAKKEYEYYKSLLFELDVKDMVRFDRERVRELEKKRDDAFEAIEKARVDARPRTIALLEQFAEEDLERRKALAEIEMQRLEEAHRENFVRGIENRREEAKERRASLVSKMNVLEEAYKEERSRLEQFGGATSRLEFAKQTLELENETMQRLTDRISKFRTEGSFDGDSVITLSEAQIPKAPIETVPVKKMLVASGAAFVFPFLLGFLWEFRVQRVTDSRIVERARLAPVVGEVAKLPSGGRSAKGRRMFEESVDTLRSNLFLSRDTSDTRSIAVVSSMSGEGKSSVASQLALSIAKATGQTVLLVDTDLRCPDQHEIFGIDSDPGLTAVLAGQASIDEAVNTSLGDLIHVLPAGKLDRSPHRLMSPEAMQEFIKEVKAKYEFVVFDTAPVLSAGETLALASAVDSTLICVMRDVSRIDNVTRTSRRLEASGARVAGMVFSGVSTRQYSYRYGDYHYAVTSDFKA